MKNKRDNTKLILTRHKHFIIRKSLAYILADLTQPIYFQLLTSKHPLEVKTVEEDEDFIQLLINVENQLGQVFGKYYVSITSLEDQCRVEISYGFTQLLPVLFTFGLFIIFGGLSSKGVQFIVWTAVGAFSVFGVIFLAYNFNQVTKTVMTRLRED